MAQHNISSQPTAFIGRTQQIAEIGARLSDENCRLLSVLGPGGAGKTRVAIEVMRNQLEAFVDGVWLVRLQPVNSANLVVPAIAEAINFSFSGPEAVDRQLMNYLRDRETLLLLDNYEQLLDADGLYLLVSILEAAPSVKLLVTSREALNLKEEWRYPITGLSMSSAENYDDLEGYDAIQLFITCARRVYPPFDLADESDCVVRICNLVAGMPLAIEMAASWLSSLSCQDVATRIERGMLDTRLRNVPERHRSMSGVFEQSWKLLDENERSIFCKLSVFAGGFRSDAAEQVADADSDKLATLAGKSLLQLDSSGRFRIHELIRQLAKEKLKELPEQREVIPDLHCDYYAAFLHQRKQEFRVEQSPHITKELEEETDNIRVAWNRAIERNKIEQIRDALWCLAEFYDFRGWFHEGEHLLGQAVEVLSRGQAVGARGIALGLALAGQGNFLHYLGQIERAKSLMREGVAVLRPLHALQETAHSISLLSRLYFMTGDLLEAETSYRESIALAKEVDDYVTLAFGFLNLGFITSGMGRYREARQFLQDSLTYFRRIDHRLGVAISLDALGWLTCAMGEYN